MCEHEGEILLKETYRTGLEQKEIYYVKPPDQADIVVLEKGGKNVFSITALLTQIFLPQGYPNSVSMDYAAYQFWDSAQAFCSTITGTLSTHQVLKGVGVGNAEASPLAATVTWVIKDGCGHIGRILFAYTHGSENRNVKVTIQCADETIVVNLLKTYSKTKDYILRCYLDAYSKKWRLYADTLNDASMCIEMALPLFTNYTVFALCVSTAMKSVVGVAGGATRAALTQHHAIRGNLADVSAKDSAQETAVNLVASFAALAIISFFGNSLAVFFAMMILHIVCNYFAVRAICLRTLNEPRFIQVIETYLQNEIIPTPCKINRKEPIIFYQFGPSLLDFKLCGFTIRLGESVKNALRNNSKAAHLLKMTRIYIERQYVLYPNVNTRRIYILLKLDADTNDVLCAYFHAVLLSIITCSLNGVNLPAITNNTKPRPFSEVCNTLQSVDWSREPVSNQEHSYSGFEYEASYLAMEYVDKIVQREWEMIKMGLQHTGWDLSKHLLLANEWRIGRKKLSATNITPNYSAAELTFDRFYKKNVSSTDQFTVETDYYEELINSVEKIPNDSSDSVHVICTEKDSVAKQEDKSLQKKLE